MHYAALYSTSACIHKKGSHLQNRAKQKKKSDFAVICIPIDTVLAWWLM